MPIVICKSKNQEGKVATEITSKGYCSIKYIYYYDMKLHMEGLRKKGTALLGAIIGITLAAENDLTVFNAECIPYLNGKTVLVDKIYSDFSFFDEKNPVKMLIPHKEIKNDL